MVDHITPSLIGNIILSTIRTNHAFAVDFAVCMRKINIRLRRRIHLRLMPAPFGDEQPPIGEGVVFEKPP